MSNDESEADNKIAAIAKVAGTVAGIVTSDAGKKFLCGTYSDGTPRSLTDALNGEIISPEDKGKKIKKYEKKKKKLKKKKKKMKDFNGGFQL